MIPESGGRTQPHPVILIFVMGAVGSVARHFFVSNSNSIQFSLMLVNIVGAALAGWLVRTGRPDSGGARNQALIVGGCGGLTTFSTWAVVAADRTAVGFVVFTFVAAVAAYRATRGPAGAESDAR